MSLTKTIIVEVGSILATEAIKKGYEYAFESSDDDEKSTADDD